MEDHGWYFAYGANMATRVLRRRELGHCKGQAAQLHGYRLEFSMPGLPLVEPGFASVHPDEDACVHGVLYRMSHEDLARLDAFETEQERFEVQVVGTDAGEVTATTYRGLRRVVGLKPSLRYQTLLIEGAREHGLPEPWIRDLEAQPSVYIPLLSDFLRLYMGSFESFLQATHFHSLTSRTFHGEADSKKVDPQDP